MPDPKRLDGSYARLYDDILDNEKLVALGGEAFGLYLAAISYSHANNTDGRIHITKLRSLIKLATPLKIAGKLVSAKLLEREGDWFQVHDYVLHQASREERGRSREYGLKGAAVRWGYRHPNEEAIPHPDSPHNEPITGKVKVKVKEVQLQVTEPSLLEVEDDDQVTRLFVLWREAFKRSAGTRLDDKRRKVIAKALKDYGWEGVVECINGYTHDPWPERARRNDITLLLRDAQHIEDGRALMVKAQLGAVGEAPRTRTMERVFAPRGIGEPDD